MKTAAANNDAAAVTRLKKNPTLNGMLRTTCIATMIDGGHAYNALPQHVTFEKLTSELFPGVPVVPAQASGGTDGRFLTPAGIPTYGVSGIFSDPETTRAHGLDERMRVQSLMEGREFLYRLTKMYAGGK